MLAVQERILESEIWDDTQFCSFLANRMNLMINLDDLMKNASVTAMFHQLRQPDMLCQSEENAQPVVVMPALLVNIVLI